MEKVIKCFVGGVFIILFGCSSNNDKPVVPVAPANLSGGLIRNVQVSLVWSDNSTDEIGFIIERKTGTGSYIQIGNVNTNVTHFDDFHLLPNTSYTYRVLSFNSVGNSLTYSNEVTFTTINPITTSAISYITSIEAASGGSITLEVDGNVTARGIVWSTSPQPTISLPTKTSNGTGTGSFLSYLKNLLPDTAYFVRAYATTALGTNYGNEITFSTNKITFTQGTTLTDIDGNVYSSVTNCSQTWMQKNLNVSHYRNGDIIPQVPFNSLASSKTGAWCYYQNNTNLGTVYGKLYNWYAVNDSRGLAPQGWHIPSDIEFYALRNCLGNVDTAGGKMKEIGTIRWEFPNVGADNSSGFTALPGGGSSSSYNYEIYKSSYFWSSFTEYSSSDVAWGLRILGSDTVFGYPLKVDRSTFFSVRCIKD